MKRGPVSARAPVFHNNTRDSEIVQINLDRKKISHDSIASRDNVDICVVSEPNKKIANRETTTTIAVVNTDEIRCHGGRDGFVWAEFDNTILYSCYISPNITMAQYDYGESF